MRWGSLGPWARWFWSHDLWEEMTWHINGMNHASHILGKGWEALQTRQGPEASAYNDADFVIKTERLFSFATRRFSESTFFCWWFLWSHLVSVFFSVAMKSCSCCLSCTHLAHFKLGLYRDMSTPSLLHENIASNCTHPGRWWREKNGLVEWTSWSLRVDSLEYSIWFKYIDVCSYIYLDRYILITNYLIICTYKYIYIYKFTCIFTSR